MHAAVLWRINNFPAYDKLSGWCTSGRFLACSICRKENCYHRLKHGRKQCFMDHRRFLPTHYFRYNSATFNGHEGHMSSPKRPSGYDVVTKLQQLEKISFGKTHKFFSVFGVDAPTGNWKKKSILFYLPYWKGLLLSHN